MRIYNGKNSQVDMPLNGNLRLTIPSHSVCKPFSATDQFLEMIVSNYDDTELAVVCDGVIEWNQCARIQALQPMLVQTLDEAVQRFSKPEKENMIEEKDAIEETPAEEVEEKKRAPRSIRLKKEASGGIFLKRKKKEEVEEE